MFYLALTFWLMIALLQAFAVYRLWQGIVRPRWINVVLLPGTIVAETAHFLAALLTGAPVRQAKLVSDDPIGEAIGGGSGGGGGGKEGKGVPVLSPLLLGLFPLLAGIIVIYLLYAYFDGAAVERIARHSQELSQRLDKVTPQPAEWPFYIIQQQLTLARELLNSLMRGAATWKLWLFAYLAMCLSVRMVPLRGNLRGGMAAVVLIGGLAAGLGYLFPSIDQGLHEQWKLVAYVIAQLTLLLAVTLAVRAIVALVFVLADKPQPERPE